MYIASASSSRSDAPLLLRHLRPEVSAANVYIKDGKQISWQRLSFRANNILLLRHLSARLPPGVEPGNPRPPAPQAPALMRRCSYGTCEQRRLHYPIGNINFLNFPRQHQQQVLQHNRSGTHCTSQVTFLRTITTEE